MLYISRRQSAEELSSPLSNAASIASSNNSNASPESQRGLSGGRGSRARSARDSAGGMPIDEDCKLSKDLFDALKKCKPLSKKTAFNKKLEDLCRSSRGMRGSPEKEEAKGRTRPRGRRQQSAPAIDETLLVQEGDGLAQRNTGHCHRPTRFCDVGALGHAKDAPVYHHLHAGEVREGHDENNECGQSGTCCQLAESSAPWEQGGRNRHEDCRGA